MMKKQICKNCTFYSAYYKKWSDCYGRLNNGYCSKHKKPQIQFENCGEYKSSEQKEKMRLERLYVSLERALISIDEITQILKEKNDI